MVDMGERTVAVSTAGASANGRLVEILRLGKGRLTSQQLLDLVNATEHRMTYRMLIYWRKCGWIAPTPRSVPGSGGLLIWDKDDVVTISLMLDLFEQAESMLDSIKDGSFWALRHEGARP